MTSFEGVLLKPLDQQHDRDGNLIDPNGVEFDPEEERLIFREFSYRIPDDVVGKGKVSRREDGTLVVTGELLQIVVSPERPDDPKPMLAIGVSYDKDRDGGQNIPHSSLVSIGLTWKHVDPDQPPIVVGISRG